MNRFIVLFLVLSSPLVFSKRFSNNFIEFELPVGWECQMEGAEWVCQSTVKERGQESIIIFAAKKRGKQDTLEYYQSYLKKKKSYKLPGGKTQVSEPKYVKMNKVNDHRWVDALHLSSEIPGFFTRYLATVKEDLGVAMTFSVSRREYRNYKKVFDKVVSSLRVFRSRGTNYKQGNLPKSGKSSSSIFDNTDFIPEENFDITPRRSKKKNKSSLSDGKDNLLYLVIIIIVVVIFLRKKKS